MNKIGLLAAALVLSSLPAFSQGGQQPGRPVDQNTPSGDVGAAAGQGDRQDMHELFNRLAQSPVGETIRLGVERVKNACADDIAELCGSEEVGRGRIASCVRAHRDDLSLRCRITLLRVVRAVKQDVTDFADECRVAIESQCGNTDRLGECAEQKSASIPASCGTLISAVRQVGQAATQRFQNLKGMRVVSSDNKDVGAIVELNRTPDGKIQSAQIQIGRFLGLGDKVVNVGGDKLQELGDRVQLKMNADQVHSLSDQKS